MADILEFISTNKKFSPEEVIEERITSLIVRMADFQTLSAQGGQTEIIEDWRNELTRIRQALYALYSERKGMD